MSSPKPDVDDNTENGSKTASTQVCSCDCQSRDGRDDTRAGSPRTQTSVFSFSLQEPTPRQSPARISSDTSIGTSISTLRLPSGVFELPGRQQTASSEALTAQTPDESSTREAQGDGGGAENSSSSDEDGLTIGCMRKPGKERSPAS